MGELTFSPEDIQYKEPITCIELSGQNNELEFKVNSFLSQTWDLSPREHTFGAAPSMIEIRKAVFRNKIDSIPEDYLSHDYSIRGYPKVDTVRLTLE